MRKAVTSPIPSTPSRVSSSAVLARDNLEDPGCYPLSLPNLATPPAKVNHVTSDYPVHRHRYHCYHNHHTFAPARLVVGGADKNIFPSNLNTDRPPPTQHRRFVLYHILLYYYYFARHFATSTSSSTYEYYTQIAKCDNLLSIIRKFNPLPEIFRTRNGRLPRSQSLSRGSSSSSFSSKISWVESSTAQTPTHPL